MKTKTQLLLILLLLSMSRSTFAQNQPSQPDMQAMMANMMPGQVQAMMAKSVGDWKADITMWMDPSQPASKTTAKVRNDMMMDGRYLSTKYTGTMMGKPFEGMGLMAYNNATKMFYSSWVDNMSTGMSQLSGTWKDENKSIELRGVTNDPMSGKDMMMRQVLTFQNDNTQLMEMYMTMNGQEMKTMEIKMTR
ncbi:MAG: DUF1579 domain-containing protein [Chitinophagales bacterium]|nr:DUF1579 domain-containing protein [Chitinophagales bacterium]